MKVAGEEGEGVGGGEYGLSERYDGAGVQLRSGGGGILDGDDDEEMDGGGVGK